MGWCAPCPGPCRPVRAPTLKGEIDLIRNRVKRVKEMLR